jgi:hypothetical protein
MMYRITGAVFAVLAISSCASVKPSENLKRSYTPMYYSAAISDYPSIGEVRTVEVGESLVGKDKQTTIPAIDIEQAIEHPTENIGTKFTVTILPGRYVESGKDAFGKYYEAKAGKILSNGVALASKFKAGVYISDSDSKNTEFYAVSDSGNPLSYPKHAIPFTRSIHQTRDELSFKKELVYTGISQNVVTILYREFKDDMARPAFSQDLKYDLSESKIVGYRGARFEIIKATNQGLTYKTLKQLD